MAGVHQSVASKACSLVYRVGVVDAIEKELKHSIVVAPNPQIMGALGAAIAAYEEYRKQ